MVLDRKKAKRHHPHKGSHIAHVKAGKKAARTMKRKYGHDMKRG